MGVAADGSVELLLSPQPELTPDGPAALLC